MRTKCNIYAIFLFVFFCLFSILISPLGWAAEIISCLGDSITAGAGSSGPEYTYPAQMAVMLDNYYPTMDIDVLNRGVGGYKAEDVRSQLQNEGLPEDPDFVLLMIGGNDLADATPFTIFQIIEKTTWEVQSCIDLVKAHTNGDGSHPKIIVSAFIPNLLEGSLGSLAVSWYNSSLEDNLSGHDLWFTTNWDDFYDSETGAAKTWLMSDSVHPNGDGYAVMAENWLEALQTLIPTPVFLVLESGDYNGDGTSDIAVFRESSGLWSVRGITRVYFGTAGDEPIPGDYDGDDTTDIGIFRETSALWVIRNITRAYFGSALDLPIPGDFDGDGSCDLGVFRETSALWAIRNVTRIYFGSPADSPVPGYYQGSNTKDIAIFRDSTGLWVIRNFSRFYFGASGDLAGSVDIDGDGTDDVDIFRPTSALWVVRGITRTYFGTSGDQAVPADYDGNSTDDVGIFRQTSGLWVVKGITRLYYGSSSDIPVTR